MGLVRGIQKSGNCWASADYPLGREVQRGEGTCPILVKGAPVAEAQAASPSQGRPVLEVRLAEGLGTSPGQL